MQQLQSPSYFLKDLNHPIRLINLKQFKNLGSLPRCPNDESMIKLNDMTIEEYNKSLILFISHRWLRQSHPDRSTNDKYLLCIDGIEKVLHQLAPGMEECYLWLDYACVNQDNNPANEIKSVLMNIIQFCDCIFTPIVDDNHESWKYPDVWKNRFTEYLCPAWNDTNSADCYLRRAWCRLEMFYAANIPFVTYNEVRNSKMKAGLQYHNKAGRRPHLLYGTKEMAGNIPPKLLPPLQNSYLTRYHPEAGTLTVADDISVIQSLVEQLMPYVTNASPGYTGDIVDGKKHGRGVLISDDGEIYEGDWENDTRHGKGVCISTNYDVYEGNWENDLLNGRGILRYADGDIYDGEYKDSLMHGYGVFRYANGEVYEGEWKDRKKHGRGVLSDVNQNIINAGDWEEGIFVRSV